MKYAIIRTGGKQYRVQEGDVIEIERLSQSTGEVAFSDILFYTNDGVPQLGQPVISGIQVTGTVLEQTKGPKIRVSKFKAKARYRRTTGHRQALTKVKIDVIGAGRKEKAQQKEENTSVEKPAKSTRTAKKA